MSLRRFPNLSRRAYEHPSDRAAFAALRSVPGFDTLVRKLLASFGDRALRLAFLASAVRVGPRQLKRIHDRHLEACAILDINPVPELFVAQTPFVNAGAIGVDRPFIVLNAGALALLDDDEIQFELGHELGHVLSGHALYKTVLQLLLRMSSLALSVPLGGAAFLAVITALFEWDRCSELSADRAGLLVSQSSAVAQRVTMKLAGGNGDLDVEDLVGQAEEYHASGGVRDSLLKLINLLGQSHPFPVLRIAELRKWIAAGGYEEIMGGRYATRDRDARTSAYEDLKNATRRYRDDLSGSQDALIATVRNASARAQTFGRTVIDAFRRPRAGTAPSGAKGSATGRRRPKRRAARRKT